MQASRSFQLLDAANAAPLLQALGDVLNKRAAITSILICLAAAGFYGQYLKGDTETCLYIDSAETAKVTVVTAKSVKELGGLRPDGLTMFCIAEDKASLWLSVKFSDGEQIESQEIIYLPGKIAVVEIRDRALSITYVAGDNGQKVLRTMVVREK